jgi:tRNA(His) 5'-end guanylyltransferase
VDGKAFHTLTKGFDRPFDKDLMAIMDHTAVALCSSIQGAILGFVQSDEISVLLTDFATPQTDAWFDGNIQKVVSVSASIATAAFNQEFSRKGIEDYLVSGFKKGKYYGKDGELKTGIFDSRVFTIPDRTEVKNYLVWRQADASRNSVQAAAQALYSQKELHGKHTGELQELIFQKGINWNDYCSGEKRGRVVIKEEYLHSGEHGEAMRTRWILLTGVDNNETPVFTQDIEFLEKLIPKMK